MCGASDQQNEMYTAQSEFYHEMTADYKTVFGEMQQVFGVLKGTLEPIVQAGPNQRGFSEAEHTNLDTMAKENVAKGYNSAGKVLAEQEAARGGSDFIPSGGVENREAQMASMAVNQEAQEHQQIEAADWSTGRQIWEFATGSLQHGMDSLNPAGFSNAATGAGNAAANTADQMAAASNSVWDAVIGGVAGVGAAAAGPHP